MKIYTHHIYLYVCTRIIIIISTLVNRMKRKKIIRTQKKIFFFQCVIIKLDFFFLSFLFFSFSFFFSALYIFIRTFFFLLHAEPAGIKRKKKNGGEKERKFSNLISLRSIGRIEDSEPCISVCIRLVDARMAYMILLYKRK